jgi:hypothetical protein
MVSSNSSDATQRMASSLFDAETAVLLDSQNSPFLRLKLRRA